MTSAEMEELWESLFPGIHPEADYLKVVCRPRWVRFHSLPGSKRYPDTPREEAVILSRHAALLNAIWPAAVSLAVIRTTFYPTTPGTVVLTPSEWTHWRSFTSQPKGCESFCRHVFFCERNWSVGVLDDLILETAHDREHNLMVIDLGGTALYHPYDGGMDLILTNPDRIPRLRSRFEAWLSPRPDGL